MSNSKDEKPANFSATGNDVSVVILGWYIADNADVPHIGIFQTDEDNVQESDTIVQWLLPANVEERDTLERLVSGSVKSANDAKPKSLRAALLAAASHGLSRTGNPAEHQAAAIADSFVKAAAKCAEDAPDAPKFTKVRKTVLQFTVLHDDGKDLTSLSLADIAHECAEGGYLGGNRSVISDVALTRDDIVIETLALGGDASFFRDAFSSDED